MSMINYQKIVISFLFMNLLSTLVNTQMTVQDKNFIEDYISKGQSKETGLFFENLDVYRSTKESINVMKILGRDVRYTSEICNKLSDYKEINENILSIDKLLNCKTKFKKYTPELKRNKLLELYHEAEIIDLLNLDDQWESLYKKVKGFSAGKNFALYKPKDKDENKEKSIMGTALAYEILTLIANKKPDLKSDIIETISSGVSNFVESYTTLSKSTIAYMEKNVGIYRLNYHVIKAIKSAKKLGVKIKGSNNILYKLLNYFNNFKFGLATSIDNVYYLMNIYKLLENTPLMIMATDNFNYLKEKNAKIKFQNIFGEKLDIKNATISIKIKENIEKKPKYAASGKKKKSSSYDLEDDETQSDEKNTLLGKTEKKIEITSPENEIEFDLSEMILGPGYFTLSLFMDNSFYDLKEYLIKNIRSYSEVKIESVDFEIIDKINDNNNQHLPLLKYPNKYKSEFKATQDNTLIAHVKVSYPGSQKPTIMEQVFLRLKNSELNKSYNAYATKYNEDKNEYFIGFELDDPVIMESYNGAYEISIIMSDPNINNVLNWQFGSFEISFTKPTDPAEEQRALKNTLQPKMEPTFNPEQSRSKNKFIGMVFSTIILGLSFVLVVVLIKSKSNVDNFPKGGFASLMNLLFIGVLGTVAYILFLFWFKLNILQTMFFFVVMSIPATVIVYKALKNHIIEITIEKKEEFD